MARLRTVFVAVVLLCLIVGDAVGSSALRRRHHHRDRKHHNRRLGVKLAFFDWTANAAKLRVGQRLGRGSIGTVEVLEVEGELRNFERTCGVPQDPAGFAFKTFSSADALEREASAYEYLCQGSCNSCPPGVMRYFGRATIEGKNGIVLERVEGAISDFLTGRAKFDYDTLCPLFGYEPVCPVARALFLKQLVSDVFMGIASMQARQMTHMDIKPANLFIRLEAEGVRRVVIGDLGNVDVRNKEVKIKSPGGTAAYAPKEESAPRDVGWDLYTLGTSLDEMINANTRTTAQGNDNLNAMFDDIQFDFSDKPKKPTPPPATMEFFTAEKLAEDFPRELAPIFAGVLNKLTLRDPVARAGIWPGVQAEWQSAGDTRALETVLDNVAEKGSKKECLNAWLGANDACAAIPHCAWAVGKVVKRALVDDGFAITCAAVRRVLAGSKKIAVSHFFSAAKSKVSKIFTKDASTPTSQQIDTACAAVVQANGFNGLQKCLIDKLRNRPAARRCPPSPLI